MRARDQNDSVLFSLMQLTHLGHNSEPSFLRKALIFSDLNLIVDCPPSCLEIEGFFWPVVEKHLALAGVLGLSSSESDRPGRI